MDQHQQRDVARGLCEGSATAWTALYDAYAPLVWRRVARLVGPNSADVADIVQETFLSAARSARGFDIERGSLWNWLSGIAGKTTALHYRRQARQHSADGVGTRSSESNGQLVDWFAGAEPGPPETLLTTETAAFVRRTLLQLPDDYAELLVNKYLDDASMKQIADEQNSTTEAVSSKLARARRAFREEFQKNASEDRPAARQ